MKITYDNLFKASFTILTKLGADEHEARQVSESLVRANMRGIHTHGVKYLKMPRSNRAPPPISGL